VNLKKNLKLKYKNAKKATIIRLNGTVTQQLLHNTQNVAT